jgi:ribosomal protein L14
MRDVLNWRKSRYSSSGNCVEVGQVAGAVLVRDTKRRDGTKLRFSAKAWRKFAEQVKTS